MDDRDDLTPEETEALRYLAAAAAPPAALEDRTVDRLKERGLIAGRRRARIPWLWAVAAGLALFAAGLLVGQRHGGSAIEASPMPRYALFLYDAPDETALTAAQMEARIEEYRSWAAGVRRQGSEIHGEKLEPTSRLLGGSGPDLGARTLGGYFVIAAMDYEAAVAIARTCPHLKHGGSIVVRPIART